MQASPVPRFGFDVDGQVLRLSLFGLEAVRYPHGKPMVVSVTPGRRDFFPAHPHETTLLLSQLLGTDRQNGNYHIGAVYMPPRAALDMFLLDYITLRHIELAEPYSPKRNGKFESVMFRGVSFTGWNLAIVAVADHDYPMTTADSNGHPII